MPRYTQYHICIVSEVAVVFCNAFVLHGVGPPVSSSEGAALHASAHPHHYMAIQ